MKKKEALIIFKTHLDVGFTDYSEAVIRKYLKTYLPRAIRVGYELKDTETPFCWTVGSFLIWEALKHDLDGSVEQAIRDGILSWHALPFTTHTELMSRELFEYGLSLSERLDRRFGRKTVAAKMTDVPGHTMGMIEPMADRGIRFLHIGVNPATPVPNVPSVFRWKHGDREITVMYQADYGLNAEFDEFTVCFAHTGDNCGPQSAEEIIKVYEDVARQYPDHTPRAATLYDLAERIASLKELPVVDREIGDTWIHGAATDPQKLSRFRAIQRHIRENGICRDLSDSLLLVPEHTWGMDVKKHFKNNSVYTHEELQTAPLAERRHIERSWDEQRSYVARAEAILGITPDKPTVSPTLEGFAETALPTNVGLEVSWELFDNEDYMRYRETYIRCDADWAIRDITKVGLPDYTGGIFTAAPTQAYTNGEETVIRLEFDKALAEKYGLPYFLLKQTEDTAELYWFGKKASRLPQAFWLKFQGYEEAWEVNKMGVWHRPETILDSNLICAVDEGIRNGEVTIEPLDAALVAPFGRRLLRYGERDLPQDLYFNLYNNIWNTNFPLWYSDDAMFRFRITQEKDSNSAE